MNYRIPNIMKWIQIYLIFTVVLYFFGPIKYVLYNTVVVVILLILYQVSLYIGYHIAFKKKVFIDYIKSATDFSYNDQKLIIKLSVVGIFFDVLMMIRMANSWNPSVILSKIINGITSPAIQYADFYAEATAGNLGGGSAFSLFITLGTPFAIAAIILGIFYFKELNLSGKLIVIFSIVIHIGVQLISAANEGIFDIAIYFVVTIFMRNTNMNLTSNSKSTSAKRKILFCIAAIVFVTIALSFFTNNVIGRTKANFAFSTLGENKYDPSAGINKYIPEPLLITFTYLSVYICEGYYGFSLSTMLEWIPTFGTGFSSFIRNNLSGIINYDLFDLMYQTRIETIAEWGRLRNFHTAYTFWANDLSHIGVPLAMILMGYILGNYYKKGVYYCKKTAIVMMPIMITMMFYLPANNKIFVQPSTFLLFSFCIIHHFMEKICVTTIGGKR